MVQEEMDPAWAKDVHKGRGFTFRNRTRTRLLLLSHHLKGFPRHRKAPGYTFRSGCVRSLQTQRAVVLDPGQSRCLSVQ